MFINLKVNQKIKIKDYISKEIIIGKVIEIIKIDYTRIIRIESENFYLSIEEGLLFGKYDTAIINN